MNIPCTELRYVNFSLVFKHFNLISVLRCASVYRLTIFKLQLKLNLLLELGQQLIDYGFIRTVVQTHSIEIHFYFYINEYMMLKTYIVNTNCFMELTFIAVLKDIFLKYIETNTLFLIVILKPRGIYACADCGVRIVIACAYRSIIVPSSLFLHFYWYTLFRIITFNNKIVISLLGGRSCIGLD